MDGRQKTRAANAAPSKSPWEEKPPPGRGRLVAAPSNGRCQQDKRERCSTWRLYDCPPMTKGGQED